MLFLSHKSFVSDSIPSLSLIDDTRCSPYSFMSRVTMMVASLALISWSHIMRGCRLLVQMLHRSGMCTTVSALAVTFSGDHRHHPLIAHRQMPHHFHQLLNDLSPKQGRDCIRDVGFHQPGQIADWPHQSLAHAWIWWYIDCLGVSSRQGPPQHMARKTPCHQVTAQHQFPLPKPGTCRWHSQVQLPGTCQARHLVNVYLDDLLPLVHILSGE